MNTQDYKVTLHIDGVEWIPELGPIVQWTVVAKREYGVPVVTVFIIDTNNVYGKGALPVPKNGSRLTLRIEHYGSNEFYDCFVVYSKAVPQRGGNMYKLRCVVHEPVWLLEANTGVYTGTSSDAIRQMGEECGIEVEADATNDHDDWYGAGWFPFEAVQDWAAHGWASSESLMAMSYVPELEDRKASILYKNLNTISRDPVRWFSYGEQRGNKNIGSADNPFPFTDYSVNDVSGLTGFVEGYNLRLIDDEEIYDSASVWNPGELGLDERTKQSVSSVRTVFKSVRTNSNEHYHQGLFQNERGLSVNKTGFNLFTHFPTGVRVFDAVDVSAPNQSASDLYAVGAHGGVYLVEDRIIKGHDNVYGERLHLFRGGLEARQ